MKLTIKKGTTSKIVHIFVSDSSSLTGAGLTGLAHNTASLSAYYVREGNPTATSITLVDITTLGTYISSGFKEFDATNMPGLYEMHIPDAALASGSESVIVYLKGATNMAPLPFEIQLDSNTIEDCYNQNEEIKGTGFIEAHSLALRPSAVGGGGGHCAWYDDDLKRAKEFFTSTPMKIKEITDGLSKLSTKLSKPKNDTVAIDSITESNASILRDFAEVKASIEAITEGLKTTDSILLSIADEETLEGLLDD